MADRRFEFEIEITPVLDDKEAGRLFSMLWQRVDPEELRATISGSRTNSYFYRGVLVDSLHRLKRIHIDLSARLSDKVLTSRWRYDGLLQWRDKFMFEYRDEPFAKSD